MCSKRKHKSKEECGTLFNYIKGIPLKTLSRLILPLLLLYPISLCAKTKEVNFSMVISGGVSLGAYEAGYNWAMIRMLSELREKKIGVHPELRSLTGASAGSINALISAAYWCQKPSKPKLNTIDNNLFYNTWVGLGLEDLIIKGRDATNKSTLFTRKELNKKAAAIVAHLQEPIYRKGCEVPLGFSLTKAKPMIERFQGIEIKNQHFSAPFTFREKQGKIQIINKNMPKSNDFYLSIPGIENNISKIIPVLFASSAFPGAFEQVKLDYEYNKKKYSSYFIDGGAYTNLPLQLAIELDKRAKKFLFIDPNNVRGENCKNKCGVLCTESKKKKEEEREEIPLGFFHSNGLPLLSSLDIFQSMKLYEAINRYFKNDPSYSLILSSRHHPITGEFLGHFGAFLDKNFRIYDYHVGVYDAIYHLAKTLRSKGYAEEYTSQIALMDHFKQILGIDKNPQAKNAYDLFVQTECQHRTPSKPSMFLAIYKAFNLKKSDKKRYTLKEFEQFLSKLDLTQLPHSQKENFLYYAKKDIKHWYKRPMRYIVTRIATLENERARILTERDANGSNTRTSRIIAKATSIAVWTGNTLVKEKEGFHFLPLNAPEEEKNSTLYTALRLLPSEIAFDNTLSTGISLGYSAFWYKDLGPFDGLEAKLSFVHEKRENDFLHLDVNAFYDYNEFMTLGGGLTLFGNTQGSFYNREDLYGFNTYIDLMEIFRLTYVKRYTEGDHQDYLFFGIKNIPSLIYWLNR
ncbi:hypothetical protein YH65_06960 [Sulfurovum lithotrophicum]|uniref:PNPLA domain-containing protein n=1 Tax=Sulfurovum lithotrophicum TaxID=206403 RepID=A0A7U4RQX8_9BACT|nr:patatin-like phospholipase family protein [Sulfurovum lithotrophicum]AKF25161.1 hypothetical protein YH65_06960 [Sulfurovum lithotrophicum]